MCEYYWIKFIFSCIVLAQHGLSTPYGSDFYEILPKFPNYDIVVLFNYTVHITPLRHDECIYSFYSVFVVTPTVHMYSIHKIHCFPQKNHLRSNMRFPLLVQCPSTPSHRLCLVLSIQTKQNIITKNMFINWSSTLNSNWSSDSSSSSSSDVFWKKRNLPCSLADNLKRGATKRRS